MRTIVTSAAVAAYLAAGCGEEREPKSKTGSIAPAPVTGPAPEFNLPHTFSEPNQEDKRRMVRDPIFKGLIMVRKRIREERRITVAKGVCVAWAESAGFRVTLNPGSVSGKTKAGFNFSYPVTTNSYPDDLKYPLSETNGPEVIEKNGKLYPKRFVGVLPVRELGPDRKETVTLSDQPIQDKAGRIYFTERGTGDPIMANDISNLEFTPSNALQACYAVLNQTDIPQQPADQPIVDTAKIS